MSPAERIGNILARTGGYGTRETLQELWWLAEHAPPGDIVELGTFMAQGAVTLALAAPKRQVRTVDHYRGETRVGATASWAHLTGSYRSRAEAALREFAVGDRVTLVTGESDQVCTRYSMGGAPIGLLVIDAGHRYEEVRRDWEAWEPYVENGWVAFDDANFQGPAQLLGEIEACGHWAPIRTATAEGRLVTLERIAQ